MNRRLAACWVLLVLLPLAGGCSWLPVRHAALAVTSREDANTRLQGDFDQAYYAFESDDEVVVVLTDGPDAQPTQAAVIRLFWTPQAGLTPIAPEATNATVQYIVFADRRTQEGLFHEVGVYSGAGYLFLEDSPGTSRLSGSLWQADLLLADRSERFKDLLGQSRLTGSFTARRDNQKVGGLLRQLNTHITDRLGYPRLVHAGD